MILTRPVSNHFLISHSHTHTHTNTEEAGVCVCTYSVQVCALMLGTVAGVAESFLAAGVLAQVGLFPSVTPQVDLQILQTGEGLVAAFKLTQKPDRQRERERARERERERQKRERGEREKQRKTSSETQKGLLSLPLLKNVLKPPQPP